MLHHTLMGGGRSKAKVTIEQQQEQIHRQMLLKLLGRFLEIKGLNCLYMGRMVRLEHEIHMEMTRVLRGVNSKLKCLCKKEIFKQFYIIYFEQINDKAMHIFVLSYYCT